jgi:hypothetical protein
LLETFIQEVKGAIVLRHTDKEVDMDDDFDATPRQQDIQMLHTDTDMGLEDVEPYETPVVLQRKKKRMVSALAIELSDDETETEKSLLKKGKKKKRIASPPAFELSEDDETGESLLKKGKKENKGKGKEPANKTKVRSMIVDRFG